MQDEHREDIQRAKAVESSQKEQAPRNTPVVSCFLLRTDEEEARLLLVRRSQRVGSYNARWAGISGFIEQGVSPEEQAYTEIREETGLQSDQVRMLRRGAVVDYLDTAIGRHWFIHPFLFHVLTPDALRLDWEAEEMRWIAPADMAQYPTVPKLREAYESAQHGEVVQE